MDGLPGVKDMARHQRGGYPEVPSSLDASMSTVHAGEPVDEDDMEARVRHMKMQLRRDFEDKQQHTVMNKRVVEYRAPTNESVDSGGLESMSPVGSRDENTSRSNSRGRGRLAFGVADQA